MTKTKSVRSSAQPSRTVKATVKSVIGCAVQSHEWLYDIEFDSVKEGVVEERLIWSNDYMKVGTVFDYKE